MSVDMKSLRKSIQFCKTDLEAQIGTSPSFLLPPPTHIISLTITSPSMLPKTISFVSHYSHIPLIISTETNYLTSCTTPVYLSIKSFSLPKHDICLMFFLCQLYDHYVYYYYLATAHLQSGLQLSIFLNSCIKCHHSPLSITCYISLTLPIFTVFNYLPFLHSLLPFTVWQLSTYAHFKFLYPTNFYTPHTLKSHLDT